MVLIAPHIEGAINAGGKTIAVLSGRVDKPSPRTNFDIYERIKEHGGIVSECHLDKEIQPTMFPDCAIESFLVYQWERL